MKMKEEPNALKEAAALNAKTAELNDEDIEQLSGGNGPVTGHRGCFVRRNDIFTGAISFECDECIHWKRPEGPCELGLH